jgi:hypothetical protein
MGHALIWIEGLAAMLLLAALSVACSARWAHRFRQWAVPILTTLPILLLAASLTYGAAILKFIFHTFVPHDWFLYTLSWTLVFLVGAAFVFRRGLKRTGEERIPVACSWPRGRLALALAGMAILFAITLSNMDLAVKVQLAEARAEASAVLRAMTPPPIPDKDNAAPIYQEAFAALTPIDRLPPRWKQRMETWKKKEWQQIYNWDIPGRKFGNFDWHDKEWHEFLHNQDRALTLLRRAASKPACRFPQSDPLTFFDGAGIRYSPEALFFQAVQLLSLDARVQAVKGDTRAAMDDIAALLAIARHTSDSTVEKKGWETLAAVLHLSSPKPDELAWLPWEEGEPYLRQFPKVQAAFALRILIALSSNWSSHWFWDMTREVSFLHRRGQPMPEGYEAPFWFEATVMPPFRVFLAPGELRYVRRSLKGCQEILDDPERQLFADWRELLQSLSNQERSWFYARAMRPRLESIALVTCDATTLRRLARLAVALTAYKAKHGKYADKLDELTPAFLDRLPADPWDGGRLHMKRTDEGVMLFTLRNKTDKPILSPDTAAQRRDVVFRLP